MTTTIKSRPVYPGLTADLNARRNIIVCDDAGADAVLALFSGAGDEFALRSQVIFIADASQSSGVRPASERLTASQVEIYSSSDSAIARLREVLSAAAMATRVYVAGAESVIGAVVQAAADYRINHASIRTEHRGSLKRRVQCVHCKGFIEDVTTSPVKCTHCGLHLFVRDHYSRRLAAFQGVCVDAECPGDIPEIKVLYP